ncbi:MAG: helix-turn-helix domain-containing protein [Cyanobacteria bacterium K_Offshore_surface_m2_239]|nr:helix-turn-helix domain-containing protein [Cyanobacteria bacterium K_Offshore_surface_m2_239]
MREQRLLLALEQLRDEETSPTVAQVARACGYRNLSLFRSDLQRLHGLTPSRARRNPL